MKKGDFVKRNPLLMSDIWKRHTRHAGFEPDSIFVVLSACDGYVKLSFEPQSNWYQSKFIDVGRIHNKTLEDYL